MFNWLKRKRHEPEVAPLPEAEAKALFEDLEAMSRGGGQRHLESVLGNPIFQRMEANIPHDVRGVIDHVNNALMSPAKLIVCVYPPTPTSAHLQTFLHVRHIPQQVALANIMLSMMQSEGYVRLPDIERLSKLDDLMELARGIVVETMEEMRARS